MTQAPLADVLADLATPLALSLGLELWGIELAFGGRSLVRVFVEAENGVSIEQCAELSRLLGLALEVEDMIPGAYVLEVSSPGLERTFFTGEQLARFVGRRVEITLRQPQPAWPGRRKFRGLLQNAPESTPPGEQAGEAGVDRSGEAGADPSGSGEVGAPGEALPMPDVTAADQGLSGAPGEASSPAPSFSGTHAHMFILKAEDLARPDEEEPLVSFVFADLKKAALVHSFSDQALPARGAGKKSQGKKAGKAPEGRRDSGAPDTGPVAGEREGADDER